MISVKKKKPTMNSMINIFKVFAPIMTIVKSTILLFFFFIHIHVT